MKGKSKTKSGAVQAADEGNAIVATPEIIAAAARRIDSEEKGKAVRLSAMELTEAFKYVLQVVPKKGGFAYVFCSMDGPLMTLRGGDDSVVFESTCVVPPTWNVRGSIKRADAARFVVWLKGHGPEAFINGMDRGGDGAPSSLPIELREREQPPGEYVVPRIIGAWKPGPRPTFRMSPLLPGSYDCKRMGQAVKRFGLASTVRIADGGHLVYELRFGDTQQSDPPWHRAIISPVGEKVYDIEGQLVPCLDGEVG